MDGNVTNPYSGFPALIVVQVTEQIKNSGEREKTQERRTEREHWSWLIQIVGQLIM